MPYGQYCSCARALDVVGDRWTLLIVRELLARPSRFTNLRDGLPGIASNLLSQRLKALQEDGVVERRLAATGVVYALTPWGEGLRESVEALARWGAPLMRRGQQGDEFRPHWLIVAIEGLLTGVAPSAAARIGLHVEGTTLGLAVGPDGVHVELDAGGPFDVELTSTGQGLLAVMSGARSLDDAIEAGAVLTGDRARLEQVLAERWMLPSGPRPGSGADPDS